MNLIKELIANKNDVIFSNKDNVKDSFTILDVIWDDYEKLSQYLDTLYDSDDINEVYFYTLINLDEKIKLVKGCSYKKRIGYLLMKKEIFNINKNGIEVLL